MISKALSFISQFLNKEIKMTHGIDFDPVVVSNLINPDGSIASECDNKIVLSLVNLEHETAANTSANYIKASSGPLGKANPPVYLNMYLLVSANYDSKNYLEALKILSSVISAFQANTYFTRQNNPGMKPPVEKLTLEIVNLPINELSHIWGGIGAKYVPSILYKVRMITVDKGQVKQAVPKVKGSHKNASANNR